MKYISLFMLLCLPAGCLPLSRTEDATYKWTTKDLVGYTYILQDTNRTDYTFQWEDQTITISNTTRHARYSFYDAGIGSASYGIVNGPFCAPAFSWEISRTGALVFDDRTFWLIKREGNRVFVNSDGRSEVYIRKRN